MSLVFAAITPHSLSQSELVNNALKELEGELYVMQPDTIFLISSEAGLEPEAFSVNLSPDFVGTLPDVKLHGDIELVSKMREYADAQGVTVHKVTQPQLDAGSSVALHYLTQHLPTVKIVPIGLASTSIENHYKFGLALRAAAQQTNKRIAIVSAAELGHALPNEKAGAFGQKVLDAINQNSLVDLQQLNTSLAQQDQSENEFRALVVLSGVLDNTKLQARVLAHQVENGSGLVVAQFSLI